MSFIKLFLHDLRCGIFRKRYLVIPCLIIIPCFQLYNKLQFDGVSGSLIDYLLYTFIGIEPVQKDNPLEQIQLPILWLVLVGSSLLLNLDYMLYDLTNAGQQVIYRCKKRSGWFISKCIWSILSTVVFFFILIFSEFAFVLISGGKLSLHNSSQAFSRMFFWVNSQEVLLTIWQGIYVAIFLPLISVMTLNIMEMTLCLLVKPIISFLICMSMLVLAVYCNSPYAIGNGAMTIRSALIVENGQNPVDTILFSTVVILFCIVAGTVRFKYIDILGMEE